MNEFPVLSIVTVCRNSAATIETTLQSVAEQSYGFFEHIVIDGGSTDGTNDIIRAYSDGIASYVSETDNGIYDAMNKGARLASGDYIAFLNSDDVYAHADVLTRVADVIRTQEVDAVFADVEFVSPEAPDVVIRRYSSSTFCREALSSGKMMAHPSLFLRTRIFRELGCFNSSYKIAGDFELVVRVFKRDYLTYFYLPEVLVRMRTGGVSSIGLRSAVQINKEIFRACQENGISTSYFRILSRYPAKVKEFLLR